MRASLLLLAAVAVLTATRAAFAEDSQHEHPSLLDRPHTVAELELGIIALPDAAISRANQGGATPIGTFGKGDATLQTGLHLLYRATHEWAVGAGIVFAPRPTSDPNSGGADPTLHRTHTRSYLSMGGEVRYFPIRSRWVEAWFGVTGGAVIIADRFTTDGAPVPPIFGVNTVTVSTGGFALGVQAGADYLVTDQWVIGLALRADQWILPNQNQRSFLPFSTTESSCDPLNDCPTLLGSVRAIEVGVTVGYRIPL